MNVELTLDEIKLLLGVIEAVPLQGTIKQLQPLLKALAELTHKLLNAMKTEA